MIQISQIFLNVNKYFAVNCSDLDHIAAAVNCCRESRSDEENIHALIRKWEEEGLDDFLQVTVGYVLSMFTSYLLIYLFHNYFLDMVWHCHMSRSLYSSCLCS